MGLHNIKTFRRAKWLIRSLISLENWHEVLPDLLRIRFGRRPFGNILALRNGLLFELYPRSTGLYPVFMEVFFSSVYDRYPSFRIKQQDIVIDIGAHVGFFALKAAYLADLGRVYAFEPCSSHFDLLKENVQRNRLANISIFNCAIWGSTQQLELLYSFNDEPERTSMYDIGGDKKELVAAVTLEEVFHRNAIVTCDFLKIDCEGGEYEILYNTPDHILKSIKRIAMEWHRFDTTHAPERLARFLVEKGFTLMGETDWTSDVGYLHAYREHMTFRTETGKWLPYLLAKSG